LTYCTFQIKSERSTLYMQVQQQMLSRCYIFVIPLLYNIIKNLYICNMKANFRNSKWYKILTGDTKTTQVSGSAVEIVFNKDLSSKVYDLIDKSKEFTITSKEGKTFKVKQLQTR